jgi:hypothetical protein
MSDAHSPDEEPEAEVEEENATVGELHPELIFLGLLQTPPFPSVSVDHEHSDKGYKSK